MLKNPFKKNQPEPILPSTVLTSKIPYVPQSNQSNSYSQHLIQQAQQQQNAYQQHLAVHQSMWAQQYQQHQAIQNSLAAQQHHLQQHLGMQQQIFARYIEATFEVDVFFLYSNNKLLYCDWDRTKLMKLGKKLGASYKITSLEIEYQKSRRGL